MKKIVLIVIAVFVMLSGGLVSNSSANASTKVVNKPVQSSKMITYKLPNGKVMYGVELDKDSILFFNSKKDYLNYTSTLLHNNGMAGLMSYGYVTKPTKISSKKVKQKWVNYHKGTKNWAKASSYQISSSKTYSVSNSYTYSGYTVPIGFSYSVGVTTTIPANKKKWSRLGIWADYTFTKYKYEEYYRGKRTSKKATYGVVAKKTAHYIKPKYK